MYRLSLALYLLFILQSAQSAVFTVSTGEASCGQSVTVTATLLDDTLPSPFPPIVGATVTFETSGQTPVSGPTDENGQFTGSFMFGEPYIYEITASFKNGSAVFAQWQFVNGEYLGFLPGNINISVEANVQTILPLTTMDTHDPSFYRYPGAADTQAIEYDCDDPWKMQMSHDVQGLLLYMGDWDVLQPYQFTKPAVLISPTPDGNPYPEDNNLRLLDPPYNAQGDTFSGLIQFPHSIDSLEMIISGTPFPLQQKMTLALAPLEGAIIVEVDVQCCSPTAPTITFPGSNFVPNLWVWAPSVILRDVYGNPIAGEQVKLTVNEVTTSSPVNFASCSAYTDVNGKAKCILTTNLNGHWKVSLNAAYLGKQCQYTPITSSKQLIVFGFPENGQKAFIVSNNTELSPIGEQVWFSGIDWLNRNPFGFHDSRASTKLEQLIASLGGISFGGYVITDVSTPKCAGSFTWKKQLVNPSQLPNSLPVNMGVLVADKLGPNGIFNGTWSRIVVIQEMHYTKLLGGVGYGKLAGTYCPRPGSDPIETPKIAAKPITKKPTSKPATTTTTTKKPTTKKPTTTTTPKPKGKN